MKTLLKNAEIVNVFTKTTEKENVLIEDDKIIGIGDYKDSEADICEDLSGKYICPGFIDGHIHIESTMLTPYELAKTILPHGTTSIITDPHEITNVCGTDGIKYMLESSENLPLTVYVNLPSCVPSTPFDESGAILKADDLEPFYLKKRVLGLAEMMNYVGVINNDKDVIDKINSAKKHNKIIDGHAPLLSGKALDKYLSCGISTDHECSSFKEALERVKKGQWVMIRQGTAAKNLEALLPLFDEPYASRCLLVTDDKHPADLLSNGHIDNHIRIAVKNGKSPITAIKMATINAAECFGLKYTGAVAPGYKADLVILNNLENIEICDVYCAGKKVVSDGITKDFKKPQIQDSLKNRVLDTFNLNPLSEKDFYIKPESKKCRVMEIIPHQLITNEVITDIIWDKNNGIDTDRDILKIAVIERHKNTGHKGIGFIKGTGLKKGALASSVSHDSHNLIVIGTNDTDMAIAANHIKEIGGGNVVVSGGKIIAEMPLPVAGLMGLEDAKTMASLNEDIRKAVYSLGVCEDIEPFMHMAFTSLPVIPHLKITTKGIVDVDNFRLVPLFAD